MCIVTSSFSIISAAPIIFFSFITHRTAPAAAKNRTFERQLKETHLENVYLLFFCHRGLGGYRYPITHPTQAFILFFYFFFLQISQFPITSVYSIDCLTIMVGCRNRAPDQFE
jgi:hypothetical protein